MTRIKYFIQGAAIAILILIILYYAGTIGGTK